MWTESLFRFGVFFSMVIEVLIVAVPVHSEELPLWRAPHDHGVELFRNGAYEDAASLFEEARGLGAPPANLYNLARSYEELERFTDAIRVYDEYLASDGIPPDRRVRAQERRDSLATVPGQLHIESEPAGAAVVADGDLSEALRVTPTTLVLTSGDHVINLELEGYRRAEESVTLTPGEERTLSVTLEAATAPEPPPTETPIESDRNDNEWRGAPWLLMGIGLAVGGTGIGLDIAAWARAEGRETAFDSMTAYNEWYDDVGNMALIGDILLGVGLATAAAGLIWGIVRSVQRRVVR